MQKEFLREVISIATGKQAETVADLLDTKKYINELLIAKKLDITINQARNVLYKLSDEGLVSYIRKKDKKKGWYTYFWKIEPFKALNFLKNDTLKRLELVNHQIQSRQTKVFYICERCNIEFTEENALLHDFACVECGDVLTMMDSSKILKDLTKEFSRLQKKLSEINSEIEKEEAVLEKERIKESKKVAKDKALSKASKKKEVSKKLVQKKAIKKVPKKKSSVKKKTPPKKKSKKPAKKIAKKTSKKKTVKKK